MSRLAYEIVDVFTDRPFAGNPLAVVFGADELATDQMRALAREFNLSETVFVLTPSTPDATYRARIFTKVTELPFAGHPSLGAAVTLVRRGDVEAGEVVQECGAGLLTITVTGSGTAGTLTGGEPTIGRPLDPAPLLAAVGLTDADHVGPAPGEAGCGLMWPLLRVRPDAVGRASVVDPDLGQLYLFAWDAGTATAHARAFVPAEGMPEDPATGSAALGLGVWLVGSGLLPADGTSAYSVRQGMEIHRPSTLEGMVTAVGGTATRVTVAGHVVPIASGEIAVPPFIG